MIGSSHALSLLGLAAVGVLAGAAGCSSSSGDREDTTSTHEAFTYRQDVSIPAAQFHALVNLATNPTAWQLTVVNNQATFTPSPILHDTFGVDTLTEQVAIDTADAGVCGTATITVPTLAMDQGSVQITLSDSTIDVDLTVTGTAHAQTTGTLCPNPDFHMQGVPVHVSLGVTNDTLVVVNASITLDGHTSSDCGLLGWCNGIVSSYIGDAQAKLGPQVKDTIVRELAKPATQTGFRNAVLGADEQILGLSNGHLVPGSIAVKGGALLSSIIYDGRSPSPVCTASYACDSSDFHGAAYVSCTSIQTGQTLTLSRLVDGPKGPKWLQVSQKQYDASVWTPATFVESYDPSAGDTMTYKVCASDAYGTTCSSPFNASGVKVCACTPSFFCGVDKCGTFTDNCGDTHECGGTCNGGKVCISGQCCTGENDPNCAPTLRCPAGTSDCGGYCCKCGPKDPC